MFCNKDYRLTVLSVAHALVGFGHVAECYNWNAERCRIVALCCRKNGAVDQDAFPLAGYESKFCLAAKRWCRDSI